LIQQNEQLLQEMIPIMRQKNDELQQQLDAIAVEKPNMRRPTLPTFMAGRF
jgi:hypothetical protein